MHRCALVLGGGSVRGFYHIGVIRALTERGIEVMEIAGCSAGAIVGALYASDPQRDWEDLIGNLSLYKLLEIGLHPTAMLSTKRIKEYLRALIGATTFAELKIPLAINATDINTGEEIVMREGDLVSAVLASMAIPSVFPIVERDGRMLCDGGIVNNIPIANTSFRSVIVSNTNVPLQKVTEKTSKTTVLHNVALIPLHARFVHDLNLADRDVLILELGMRVSPMDIRKQRMHELVRKGYDAAKAALSKQ